MVEEVFDVISKYARMIKDIGFAVGEDPKIIFERGGRCYLTMPGADFAALELTDVQDVTDHEGPELPAATALSELKDRSAMIITEPPYMGILLDSHHELAASLDDMAQIVGPVIEIVPAERSKIKKALKSSLCVMTEGGHLISSGRTLFEAFTALGVAEKAAEVTLKAQVTGGAKPLPRGLAKRMHRKYLNKYSKAESEVQAGLEKAFYIPKEEKARDAEGAGPDEGMAGAEDKTPELNGKPDMAGTQVSGRTPGEISGDLDEKPQFDKSEQRLREELVLFGRMLTEKGLVQGTWGNLSIRLDDGSMLCTPSGIDYERLRAADMVKVGLRDLKAEGIHEPTSEKGMHAGLYREFPEAGAVIHTHSKYISIFAASEMPLQVEDVGKMTDIGEMIRVTKYALSGTAKLTRYATSAIKGSCGAILSHHGLVAYGKDLKEAFDRAVAIEEAAKEYVDKRWEK